MNNTCELNSRSPFGADSFSTENSDDATSPKTRLNILVVDDDDAVRNLLATILRRACYEVQCANDGEEAWSLLCTGNYDGMITDHEMPRLSGLDLVRRLRAIQSTLPVILISGHMPTSEADLEELISPGMPLDKPFSFDKLLAAVRTLFTPDRFATPLLDDRASSHSRHSSNAGVLC